MKVEMPRDAAEFDRYSLSVGVINETGKVDSCGRIRPRDWKMEEEVEKEDRIFASAYIY